MEDDLTSVDQLSYTTNEGQVALLVNVFLRETNQPHPVEPPHQ